MLVGGGYCQTSSDDSGVGKLAQSFGDVLRCVCRAFCCCVFAKGTTPFSFVSTYNKVSPRVLLTSSSVQALPPPVEAALRCLGADPFCSSFRDGVAGD